MDNSMQVPEQVQYLYSKQYKEEQIVDETQFFSKIIKGLQLIPIDDKFFKTIQTLIRYFKFSFLILLKNPVQRILNNPTFLKQRQSDLKKIAKLAHDMIGPNGHIYELDFLFLKGMDHKYYKQINIKPQKRQFINYIKSLSQQKKILYDKIKQKTITQDDIIKFQSLSFGKFNSFLQLAIQDAIKISVKDIEAKYQQLQRQRKKQVRRQLQLMQQEQIEQQIKSPVKQSNPKKQQQDLEDILVCCRRSFYHKEIIHQPQSLHVVYKYYNDFFKQDNYFQIIKNINGFLNSEGGTIFIGVKEDKNTYKKQVQGYTIIEKDKVQFRRRIDQLVDKCIMPSISHDMLKVLFVPLKSYESGKFISGKYLIKICVKFGERKQFYSFKESADSKRQFFAIRTDNDTKMITSAQQILNIYKNRVLQTPPDPQPVHKDPCPKPQIGRPIYEISQLGRN